MEDGIFRIERDGFFAGRDGVVVILQFVVAAAEPVLHFGVLRILRGGALESGDCAGVVAGVELALGSLDLRRGVGADSNCSERQDGASQQDRRHSRETSDHFASVGRIFIPSSSSMPAGGSATLSPCCRPESTW